jgi:hypothetical protein
MTHLTCNQAEALIAWRAVCTLRQAMRDATTLPARFAALCAYQGALASFADAHWTQLDALFTRPDQYVVTPSIALLASVEEQLRGVQRQLANAANEPAVEFAVRKRGKSAPRR